MGSGALLVSLGHEARPNLGPDLLPAATADEIAQGEHGIDVLTLPMHSGAFEARLDHQFVGALDHTAADGPICLAEGWILELRFPDRKKVYFQAGQTVEKFVNDETAGLLKEAGRTVLDWDAICAALAP